MGESPSPSPPPPPRPAPPATTDAGAEQQEEIQPVTPRWHAQLSAWLRQPGSPVVDETLLCFEKATHLQREQLFYVFVLLLAVYLVLGYWAQLLCTLIGAAYPAYASIKAIHSEDKEDDTRWLIYWAVFGCFSTIDAFAEGIMRFFPAYWLAKCVFLLYLYLPSTNGALVIYEKFVAPFYIKFEPTGRGGPDDESLENLLRPSWT